MQKQTEAHPPGTYLCSPKVDQSHNNVRQHDLDSHVLAEKSFFYAFFLSLRALPFLFLSFLMRTVYHALYGEMSASQESLRQTEGALLLF